jgi:hypothetical protein
MGNQLPKNEIHYDRELYTILYNQSVANRHGICWDIKYIHNTLIFWKRLVAAAGNKLERPAGSFAGKC